LAENFNNSAANATYRHRIGESVRPAWKEDAGRRDRAHARNPVL